MKKRAADPSRRADGRGFTLLEMLVVIVLAGILVSVVTISVTPDPRQKLTREAQRVGQLMALASDEARIRQLPIVWEADLRGYRFVAEVAGERQLLTGDDLLRERVWETPLTRLSVQDGAGPQPAQVLLGPGAPPGAHGDRPRMGPAALAAGTVQRGCDGESGLRRVGPRHGDAMRPGVRGFTLLEVLIALVIIGVALAAAMRGAMSLTSTAEYTREKMLAVMTAENRLLELRLARERLEQGESTLPCEQGGITFQCVQAVKPTPNPFFRRVEVRVLTAASDGSPRVLAELMTVLPTNQ